MSEPLEEAEEIITGKKKGKKGGGIFGGGGLAGLVPFALNPFVGPDIYNEIDKAVNKPMPKAPASGGGAPTPPTPEDPAVAKNLENAKATQRMARGRASTILTLNKETKGTTRSRSLLGY